MSVGVILAVFFTNTSSFKREIAALFHCITFGMYKVQKVRIYPEECYHKEEIEFCHN